MIFWYLKENVSRESYICLPDMLNRLFTTIVIATPIPNMLYLSVQCFYITKSRTFRNVKSIHIVLSKEFICSHKWCSLYEYNLSNCGYIYWYSFKTIIYLFFQIQSSEVNYICALCPIKIEPKWIPMIWKTISIVLKCSLLLFEKILSNEKMILNR